MGCGRQIFNGCSVNKEQIFNGCSVNKVNTIAGVNYIIEDELCPDCIMKDARTVSKKDQRELDLAEEQELKKLFECNEKI